MMISLVLYVYVYATRVDRSTSRINRTYGLENPTHLIWEARCIVRAKTAEEDTKKMYANVIGYPRT